MDYVKPGMQVKVKATGQTGVIYGPAAGSGTSFTVLESDNRLSPPIPTNWEAWYVSLNSDGPQNGCVKFFPYELDEVEDEKYLRERHTHAKARWQEFLMNTYGPK